MKVFEVGAMGLVFHAKVLGIGLLASTLAACGSGGGSVPSVVTPVTGTTPAPTTTNKIRATGETIAQRIESGQIAQAGSKNSTGIQLRPSDKSIQVVAPSKFQVRNNYVGGLDVSVEGDIVNLTETEIKPDLNSWGKTASGYSLALWNAGRGGREGLFRDEEGQKFHKIIGYRHQDTKTKALTLGHSIIGVQTPASAMKTLPRKIQYDGYFFANAMPGASPNERDAIGNVGGLRIDANFDTQKVVGKSTSFDVKGPTDLGAIASGDTMRFNGTISGTSYTGNIVSSQAQLNGAAIEGQFYGAGAQETAGVIRGQNAAGAVQGFFTASDSTQ